MTRDFESDVKFNKYHLDSECEQHASIYFYWADKLAKAKNNLGDSEDKLKLITSQVDSYYRENWTSNENEWGKKTEGAVAGKVNSDEKVREVKEEFMNYQHEVNTLIAAVTAMEHRRDMLKCEKELLIGGFYASPDFSKKDDVNGQAARELRQKKNPKENK
jgi:hypothetical protein